MAGHVTCAGYLFFVNGHYRTPTNPRPGPGPEPSPGNKLRRPAGPSEGEGLPGQPQPHPADNTQKTKSDTLVLGLLGYIMSLRRSKCWWYTVCWWY
jgi:hypothetical protein